MDDDIYGNLENYNEVNVVDELKNENKELKFKLDEYSTAMSALQKDFDKLNSEYKKLEYNYTSLLKTARAEIERKTLMITQLNKEKDVLIIKSIQKTGRNILNKIVYGNDNQGSDKSKTRDTKRKDETSANQKKYSNVETKEISRPQLPTSPICSISSVETTSKSTSSDYNLRKNTCEKGNTEVKENILKTLLEQQLKDSTKEKSKKIMNRRKSMPIQNNVELIFSSDEEYQEKSYYGNKKDVPNYNIHDHKGNSGYDKRNYKMGESHTNESYNTYASEKLRDRIDGHHRSHKRPFRRHSPEKDRYRSHRIQGHYSRINDRNSRDMERSSFDKYNRSKSRDRRYQERDYDRFGSKHKWSDFDSDERMSRRELDHKRRKIESISTDTENIDRIKGLTNSKDTESRVNEMVQKNYEISCQSPEYTQIDPNVLQYVKEIKSTATLETTLEDPRITSKKYVVKNTDDRNFLITTNASNLNMIPVDKSRWGLRKVDVPENLKESSKKSNETLIHDVYTDVDNPGCKVSMESGQFLQDDWYFLEKKVTDTSQPTDVRLCHNEQRSLPTISDGCTTHLCQKEYKINKLTSYKIPKKNQKEEGSKTKLNDLHSNKETEAIDKNPIKSTMNTINETLSKNDKFASIKESLAGDLELSDEASDITDDLQINDDKDNKFQIDFMEKNRATQNVINEPAYTTKLGEIQGKSENNCKEQTTLEKCKEKMVNKKSKKESGEKTSKRQEKIVKKDESSERVPNQEHAIKTFKDDCKDTMSEKREETKSNVFQDKIPKVIEQCKEKMSNKTAQCRNTKECKEKIAKSTIETKPKKITKEVEKKQKSKKRSKTDLESDNFGKLDNNPSDNAKEQKPTNKFTELFGESNSLITPDDLGMASKIEAKNKDSNKFVSLFDNTQDAIDLNIEEIKKIQNTERNSKNVHFEEKIINMSEESNNEYIVKNLLPEVNYQEHGIVYENLKPQDNHEPHVVKTVIISTGVQPDVEQNKTEPMGNIVLSNNEIGHFENKHLPLDLLQALATSTPHKTPSGINLPLLENSSTENVETNNADISASNASQSSSTHLVPETVAPDLRMFVKRRKKFKKAP